MGKELVDNGDKLDDRDTGGDVELNDSFILFDDVFHVSNVFNVGLESILFTNDDEDCKQVLLLFPTELML